jgi:putative ABC transport system permease protein
MRDHPPSFSDHPARPFFLGRLVARNLRGGLDGFRVFIGCVALGVAALTGITLLAQSLGDGLAVHGRRILGGDLSISRMQRPATSEELAYFQSFGPISTSAFLRAMVRGPDGKAGLVEVKAVDGHYPRLGTVELDPALSLPDVLRAQNGIYGAAADPLLFARLGLKPGDFVEIGSNRLQLRSVLQQEPDKLAGGLSLGPRLLISQTALNALGLVRPDAIIRYALRLELTDNSDAALDTIAQSIPARFPESAFEIRTRRNAAPQFSRNLERFAQFLALVGLTALVIGGIGVANATARYIERRREPFAIMKALGASGTQTFVLALAEVMVMGLIGTVIGLVIGMALPFGVETLGGRWLPVPLATTFYPTLVLTGLAYGLLTVLAFALLPLGRAHDVPVAALFRDGLVSLKQWPRPRYRIMAAGALLALGATAVLTAYDRKLALWSIAIIASIFVILRLVGLIVMKLAKACPHPPHAILRLALANIHRPAALTPVLVLSIGLGITLLVAISAIDASLRQQLRQSLPERAPNFFFLDIPQQDLADFRSVLKQEAPQAKLNEVPMMRGRVTALNAVPAEQIKARDDIAWVLEGDRGITYAARPPEGAQIIDGDWWPETYQGPPLVSLDAEIAKGFQLKIGDTISVNVLGRIIEARIANLRRIEWQSLGINFVLVFSPNTFAGAPATTLATLTNPTTSTPLQEAALLATLAQRFPGITSVRVKEALEAIDDLVGKLIAAIRGASLVTLTAAFLVLAGALGAGQQTRLYDAVILKTLGATRPHLISACLIEYGVIAACSAVFGLLAGSLVAQAVVTKVMKLSYAGLDVNTAVLALGTALLSTLLGLLGTWRVLGEKPARHLRAL